MPVAVCYIDEQFYTGIVVVIAVVSEDVERIEDFFILKFKNFDSDQHVEFLVGTRIFVDSNDLYPLDDNTYYIHDLIGCKVFFNDKFFGIIEEVLHLVSNDIYVVRSEDKEINDMFYGD